jgi:hypothetical protein
MAILGTLLMVAGPSVAKILLKKYLAGVDVVEIVGGKLADIAAAGLKEEMERRQAVRIFEWRGWPSPSSSASPGWVRRSRSLSTAFA